MTARQSVTVRVETRYLSDQSEPAAGRYVFAYTITLHNDGSVAAQLRTRHWLITDANGRVQEVRGDGVVGEQPHLQPGDTYRYTSGCVLDTPVGVMQGSYGMVDADGAAFTAPIAPFRLAVPGVLH